MKTAAAHNSQLTGAYEFRPAPKLTGYRDARCQARNDAGVRCGKNAGHLGDHLAHDTNDGKGGGAAGPVTWK